MNMSQEILDSTQYAIDSILKYEKVYGEDFVAPGGKPMARELIGALDLPAGSRVLDAGCGLGGSAFLMAKEFDFQVEGIDLSVNMINIAQRKLKHYGLSDRVKLTLADCMEMDKSAYFDAVYSRDVFLHINDKSSLFKVLYQSMKGNGNLLFTDYCCGEKPWQPAFSEYVNDRGYSLHTIDSYVNLLSAAGFDEVEGIDMSERFIDILRVEIERINLSGIEKAAKDRLSEDWQEKIRRTEQGDHRWGLFKAYKPADS